MTKKRVCIIGAGPSGLSVLYQLKALEAKGLADTSSIEAVCYEKQGCYLGMWNYTKRTGKNTFKKSHFIRS